MNEPLTDAFEMWWTGNGLRGDLIGKSYARRAWESQQATIERLEGEKAELRKILWLGHGCSFGSLYGDDGEMQCGRCRIDFKRDPIERLHQRIGNV